MGKVTCEGIHTKGLQPPVEFSGRNTPLPVTEIHCLSWKTVDTILPITCLSCNTRHNFVELISTAKHVYLCCPGYRWNRIQLIQISKFNKGNFFQNMGNVRLKYTTTFKTCFQTFISGCLIPDIYNACVSF